MKLSTVNTSSRDNNFNIIRLVAAISVTFAHSFALLYGKTVSLWGMNSGYFGSMAVAIFFTLSGYLITQSFCQNPQWKTYLKSRVLRIFPGLFFANFVTISIVGFFVKSQGLSLFLDSNNLAYLFNATVFKTYNYGEVFAPLPHTAANGSLWTLPVEFRMYLFVLLLGVMGFLRKRLLALATILILAIAGFFQISIIGDYLYPLFFDFSGFDIAYLNLAMSFGMGMLFYLFREKIILSIPAAIFAIAVVYWAEEPYLKYFAMPYAAIVFGSHPKLYIKSFNFKNDISYGIYVLSFPIQQTFIFNQWITNPWLIFICTMLIVTPLALFSWKFIEKPALKWKK